MSARLAALLAAAVVVAGCGSTPAPPQAVSVSPVEVLPSGAREVTAVREKPDAQCDTEASLPPGPLPAPGDMPPGSTMADIVERGQLVVGVDQNTYPFGFRNPATGRIEGFDVDVAREIARALFGDPDRIELQVVNAGERESKLASGQVDMVVRTYSVTCERKLEVAFSTVYFRAEQRILAARDSRITSAADLADKRVCAVQGTTSLARLFAMQPRPVLYSVPTWTDCLLMLQQGKVDAVSTDNVVLAGLAKQDPTVEMVGNSMGSEPYGVGMNKDDEDLVRFVNATLERMRADGTWERLYQRWLNELGPSPGPPAPRYEGQP